ncbi:D-amino-acid transaminase [Paenibacillus sp. B01]|uniref:D-amino-acid transaminase n=1 Tax=Paenibacillus sp. B01 TaxID=2660554 RepID=UPI00129B52A7|nr:D-amino-acid transaminase [Paenibacillus sp. B01]QGG58264.1 D-amino-acid transaminase [Paenibacillus sp. B01]
MLNADHDSDAGGGRSLTNRSDACESERNAPGRDAEAALLRRLLDFAASEPELLADLRQVREHGPPGAWLAAGYVRNLVWDRLHGRAERTPLDDADVVYFDPACPDEAAEKPWEQALAAARPGLRWSVKNQARMHPINGDEPFAGVAEAMSRWPETATPVALRLSSDDQVEALAPHGLSDLFAMKLRPSPLQRDPSLFARRVAAKGWLERWPLVRLADGSGPIGVPQEERIHPKEEASMTSLGYINGRFVSLEELVLPIEERGHQFGDGVYEFFRVYEGHPFMLEEHLDRLYRSADLIRIDIAPDRGELRAIMDELVTRSGLASGDIYLQVTRGVAPRNHAFPSVPSSLTMTIKPWRELAPGVREQGVQVLLHPDERWLNCHIKSLNLLPNILAKQAAVEAGCFEAVLVRDGFVTEGSSSNAYLVRDGAIRTHPATNHILGGIARIAVRRIAEEQGIPFIEEAFGPEELLAADEAFLTSSGIELVPIAGVHGRGPIGSGSPGPVARAIHARYAELTRQR